jgi:hypothetical protein
MEWYNWIIFICALIGIIKSLNDWAGPMVQGDFPEHKDPPENSE